MPAESESAFLQDAQVIYMHAAVFELDRSSPLSVE